MVTDIADSPEPQPRARMKLFRKPFAGAKLAPDFLRRQSSIARLAFEQLGGEGAKAFLNTRHDKLAGRPLDVAMNSDDGLACVVATLALLRPHGT